MKKTQNKTKEEYAEAEYQRLTAIYREAGVDEIKLRINDSLIRKVAEIFGILESIKSLPSLYFDPKNPVLQRETAVGKARVKYMAQYTSAMQKLNRDMLGDFIGDEDDGLDDYE